MSSALARFGPVCSLAQRSLLCSPLHARHVFPLLSALSLLLLLLPLPLLLLLLRPRLLVVVVRLLLLLLVPRRRRRRLLVLLLLDLVLMQIPRDNICSTRLPWSINGEAQACVCT